MRKKNKENFFYYMFSFQKYLGWKIYLFFALTVFAAVSEGLGIVMVLPLLETLSNVDSSSGFISNSDGSWALEVVTGWLLKLGASSSMEFVLLVITLAFILKGIINFFALSLSTILAGNLLSLIKEKLFFMSQSTTYNNFIKKDSGYYTSLINDQAYRSVEAFKHFSKFVAYLVNSFIYIVLAFAITWKFASMMLIVGFLIMSIFRILNSYVRKLSRHVASNHNLMTGHLIENFRAYKYLKATNQQQKLSIKFKYTLQNYINAIVKNGIFASLTQAVREPIAVVFIMCVVAIQIIYLGESLTPILVAILLFYRGMNSVLGMQTNLQHAYEFTGSFEVINDQIKNFEGNQEVYKDKEILNSSDITFKNVNFAYSEKSDFRIKDISIALPSNKTIAIIGPSGSGKSTIIDLITGLILPQTGEVLVNGKLLDRALALNWRSKIGYVTQDPVLFNTSIFNNVSMFDEKNEINIKNAENASRHANIYSFISELDNSFEEVVGENGVFLSGGQKQRIAIARELYRKPEILILDEATSSLDTESEQLIQKSIDNLSGKMSIFIIAHRLSTIKNADQIILIDKGKIEEIGTFNELYNKNESALKKLINMQNINIQDS
jgi:subfamily B ATP-binding cassette protein MsbA